MTKKGLVLSLVVLLAMLALPGAVSARSLFVPFCNDSTVLNGAARAGTTIGFVCFVTVVNTTADAVTIIFNYTRARDGANVTDVTKSNTAELAARKGVAFRPKADDPDEGAVGVGEGRDFPNAGGDAGFFIGSVRMAWEPAEGPAGALVGFARQIVYEPGTDTDQIGDYNLINIPAIAQ